MTGCRQLLRRECYRRIQINVLRNYEIRRQDSDHAITVAVESESTPNNIRIGAEAADPEAVAQNDYAIVARLIFFGEKRAALRHIGSEGREIVVRDSRALKPFRLACAREVDAPARLRRDLLKRTRHVPVLVIAGRADRGFGQIDLRVVVPYQNKLLGIFVW